ncbi:MAG TPA: hypothetical protein VLJ58_21705 [Ramlibacter sp.]|nr:hypothetical protein [Ramlibacter sp.]
MRVLMLRFMRLGWPQQLIGALPGFTTCVMIALAAGFRGWLSRMARRMGKPLKADATNA